MHAYATPRSLELWRHTTPAIAGQGAAMAPFAFTEDTLKMICVRDYACPKATAALRRSLNAAGDFPDCPVAGEPLQGVQIPAMAYVENPATRLRAVWEYRLCDPAFFTAQPHRLGGVKPSFFGDFCRWVMAQDPLAIDELLRPQWAMLPVSVECVRMHYPDVTEPSTMARELAQMLYAADYALWERAGDANAA